MKAAIVAALLAIVASPSVAQPLAAEIESAHQLFAQALTARNPATIAATYTEHAIVLPPNAEMVEGRQAIENYWRGVMEAGLTHLRLTTTRVDEYGGDTAREIGVFSVETTELQGPTAMEQGKYVVVWRKTGDHWQLDSLIWNFTGGT